MPGFAHRAREAHAALEREEAEALSRARRTVRRRQNVPENRRGETPREAEVFNLIDSDDEFQEPSRGQYRQRSYRRGASDWGAFSSGEEDIEEPDGVRYYPSSRIVRPERLFRRQDFGRIEPVNLY